MWPDDNGDWSVGDAFAEPVTPATVPVDLSMATQKVDGSGTGSSWGGFLQGALGKVVDYTMAKDARQSQANIQRQQQQALAMQPIASTAGGRLAVNPMLLLIAGGIGLAVVLARRG